MLYNPYFLYRQQMLERKSSMKKKPENNSSEDENKKKNIDIETSVEQKEIPSKAPIEKHKSNETPVENKAATNTSKEEALNQKVESAAAAEELMKGFQMVQPGIYSFKNTPLNHPVHSSLQGLPQEEVRMNMQGLALDAGPGSLAANFAKVNEPGSFYGSYNAPVYRFT